MNLFEPSIHTRPFLLEVPPLFPRVTRKKKKEKKKKKKKRKKKKEKRKGMKKRKKGYVWQTEEQANPAKQKVVGD